MIRRVLKSLLENNITKEFYTNAVVKYGKVLYRGYAYDDAGNKKRVHGKVNYKPTLYLESDTETDYKSLFGKALKPKQFDTITLAKEFVKSYEDVMPIYGYATNRFEYNFLADSFPDKLELGVGDINICIIDIETTTDHGKIDTVNVPEEITLISYLNHRTKKIVTFGSRKSTTDNYILCRDEKDLLTQFVKYVEQEDCDIFSGWNISGFDVPYLVNRGYKIIGEDMTKRLSPFGQIDVKEENIKGKSKQVFTIVGRTVLDMLELYLKFTFVKRSNNRLDTIAKVELGHGKLENPYATFKEFYETSWNLFVSYNQVDCIRVSELEDKLGLIALAMTIAYKAKINLGDVYGPVKIWECLILGTLHKENTFVPIKRKVNSSDGIIGAYVHDPKPGFYDWIVSVDAAQMYPNVNIGLNMSPETIVDYIFGGNDVDMLAITNAGGVAGIELSIANESGDTSELIKLSNTPMFYALKLAHKNDYACAANGALFSKKFQGIIPRLMQQLADDRSQDKKQMLEAKQKFIDTGDIKYKLISVIKGTSQLALKTLSNSGYGAISQSGFMFFDNRIAEGITMSGRYIIQYVSSHFNIKLNNFFKTTGFDYVAYMDTDSCQKDSLVYVNDKQIPIADLYDKFSEFTYKDDFNRSYVKPVHDVYTKSFNTEHELIEDRKITYVMKHKVKKEMFEITTEDGRSVVVTEDHSVIVKRNGVYMSVSPNKIDVDNDVVINIPIDNNQYQDNAIIERNK